jgi:hypothetical protein
MAQKRKGVVEGGSNNLKGILKKRKKEKEKREYQISHTWRGLATPKITRVPTYSFVPPFVS